LDFTLLVTLIKLLLQQQQQQQQLFHRYVGDQSALDDVTFEPLRHEWVVGRGLATEVDEQAFVWRGTTGVEDPNTAPAAALAPTQTSTTKNEADRWHQPSEIVASD
jgi:hypothetical protein